MELETRIRVALNPNEKARPNGFSKEFYG